MAPEPSRRPDADEPRRVSDHLREYLREPMLWPVLSVAVVIFVTLGIAALLFAVRLRSPFAMAAVALLAGMTVDLVVRELRAGGPGIATGLGLAFWTLSGAGAFAAVRLGLF